MSMTPFIDVRLPDDIEKGASGGPEFNTVVIPLDNGFERRNAAWSLPRGAWDIGYGVQYKEDYEVLVAFFYARMGKLVGFRFKDWTDYEIKGQILTEGTAGDTRTVFDLFKRYESGGVYFDRPIKKPVNGTFSVYKNGAQIPAQPGADGYSLDYNTGRLTLGKPLLVLEKLTFTTEFDVPVRFDTDKLDVTAETFEAGTIPSIPIIELKRL